MTAAPIIWDKQADPTLISNYSDYFKNRNAPVPANGNTGLFLANGVLSAYNKYYLQAITTQGLTVFTIDNATVIRKISPPVTSKSEGNTEINRITTTYENPASFFSDAPVLEAYLEITYKLNGDIKIADSIDYYHRR